MMRFLLLPILLAVAPCNGQNNAGTLQNDGRLSKFVQLMDQVGISPSIAETIFAPTTDAFQVYREKNVALWNKYTSQPEFFVHLRELLLWHFVTEGKFLFDEIFDGNRKRLENTKGNITIDQRFKKIDNVASTAFIDPNITTSDGVIHVLSDVIVPPYMTMNIIQQMLDDQSWQFAFTTMANLALYVGLDEEINKMYEHGLTFLVPPNPRFNRAQINVPALLTEEMKSYTRDFVLCHMILDNYHEAGIFAANEENGVKQFLVTSFLGTSLWITTTEDRLRFQSVDVLVPDQVSNWGIFHGIDMPLLPPFASNFAEFTPISTDWDTSDCFRFFRQTLLSSEDIALMFNTTLTVFCPTREALAQFNNLDFNRLLEPIWVRHATEFLFNHISSPARTRQELVNESPGYITMLNGAVYELRRSGDRPRIKNFQEQGRSDFGDLIALDGYLHLLDSAITPTAVSQSVYDQSNNNPDFSLLIENIDFVDLTNLVDQDTPLTLLAPNNQAWRRVVFGTLDGGEIIKRHIFRGLFFLDVIANQTQITAVNGVTHGVELRGEFNESLYVGGAYVYDGDILARNGVIHYVDRVIAMEYPTVPPTSSPAPTITAEPTKYIPPTAAPIPVPTGGAPVYLPPQLPPTTANGPTEPLSKIVQSSNSAAPGVSVVSMPIAGLVTGLLLILLGTGAVH